MHGGRLPGRHRERVAHDVSCRTWLLRVFVRGLVINAAVMAVLFALLLVFVHFCATRPRPNAVAPPVGPTRTDPPHHHTET